MPMTLDEMMTRFSPEERAEIERGGAEIVAQNRALRELRRSLGVTQNELAEALKTSQANVARIEGKEDLMVSTVTRVVEALGGRLRIVVDMPGRPTTVLKLPVIETKGRRVPKAKSMPKTGLVEQVAVLKQPKRRRPQVA
jgi:predicted transcriptional regulator